MKIINTDQAPKAIGPYSQAIEINNIVFCSGQIGLNPETGDLVEGVEKQTKQIMNNIQAVLKAADCELDNVVKTTIFLAEMNNFVKVNEIYGSYFSEHKPARSTVGVASLPKGALVEIEVIAAK